VNAADFTADVGQQPRGVTEQPRSPRLGRPNLGLHNAPALPAIDFNFDAIRLRFRASAKPQSAISDDVVVAFPMNTRSFVVQWRRTVPARGRADGGLTMSVDSRSVFLMIDTHFPRRDRRRALDCCWYRSVGRNRSEDPITEKRRPLAGPLKSRRVAAPNLLIKP
jgi:hypothetical protein